VIPPNESVLSRRDSGTLVQKVFALRNSTAKALGDVIKDAVPDYAKLNIDEESNQVAIIGPISLQQRMERLITSLDRPSSAALQTETFRLRYADAEAVKANIEELFQGESGAGGGNSRRSGQNNQNNQGPGGLFRFAGVSGGGGEGGTSASTEVRVTANAQQNAVTVVADPTILDQIRMQIQEYWDKQLPEEAVVPKVYDLKNSDPIKIRDALEGMFGRANPQAGRTNQGGGGGQQGGTTGSTSTSQGVGRLAGQFSFQAVPDAGRLIVVAKSQDNLAVIDKIIADLDQPQTVGLPAVVELKHANGGGPRRAAQHAPGAGRHAGADPSPFGAAASPREHRLPCQPLRSVRG
jgi:type II secretory pathway component GspD/PulD (secretin)